MNEIDLNSSLEPYYRQIKEIILDKQNPITGLLPASTAVTVHGDYRDAWVRDNVYSILAVWGLAIAYRRVDDDGGRGYELQRSTTKLMRGLLQAMMRQADKVEKFKKTLTADDALHAKYDTETGSTVVGDLDWGHLQIDATSLFLLMLAQMTASGIDIIYTLDEVNFVQNLIFYIDRAHRTPDYGIWERGAKTNHGQVELNASSVGMAKAALEALAGLDLFGARGSQASVLHVLPDSIALAEITLRSMLPRESSTKEVDGALLSIIGFPAFAIDDKKLVERTKAEIIQKLEGRYGLKRFLRDGHQTKLEDEQRLHYEPEELKRFENIESEWPLFFTYLYLDGLFRGELTQSESYARKLRTVAIVRNGYHIIPELYYVPAETIPLEKAKPRSQMRFPNDNVPLVWAQSLYLLGQLVRAGFLQPGDIDPLGRRHPRMRYRPVVQLVLLSEDQELQARLAGLGVLTETPQSLMPIEVRHPSDIEKAYEQVGRNDKLGLTGKPPGPLKSLSTSRIYRLGGKTIVCLSQLFMQREFYLTYDMDFLVARFKSELAYIHRHWAQAGRPTVTVFLTHSLLESGLDVFLELMHQIRSGEVDGVPVKAGSLTRLMPAASHERIDFLHDYRFSEALLRPGVGQTVLVDRKTIQGALNPTAELEIELENDPVVLLKRLEGTANLYEQIEVTTAVVAMLSLDAEVRVFGRLVSLRKILEEIYEEAGRRRFWAVVRRAASLLGMVEFNLTDSVNAILVRQKAILLGKSYTTDSLVVRPLLPSELLEKINTYCREDIRDRVLMQEVLVYLGQLIRARPELFEELLTIRVSYLILLLTGEIAREYHVTQDEAYNQLMHLAPSEIQRRLKVVMEHYHTMGFVIDQLESLPAHSAGQPLTWTQDMGLEVLKPPKGGWRTWRQYGGILSHVPQAFYPKVWKLFEHTRGMVIGDKLDRKNRLDSSVILSDMTPGEKAFALRIEHLLNKIPAPEYRQLTLEALSVLSSFSEQNQTLLIDDYIVLDVLIGHSVRIAYLTHYPQFADEYDEHKADAWDFFYDSSPLASTEFMIQAFKYLLDCSAPAPAQSLESVEA